LTLAHSLKKSGTKYPLYALYTDTFPKEGHAALDIRGIPKLKVDYLVPSMSKDFSNDPRFYDCWSKLTPFNLTQFDRVVQLDADMLVLKNMDELMNLELAPPPEKFKDAEPKPEGNVFAASHACVCNPLKKPHYPSDWTPANCAFTTQHDDPVSAQITGATPTAGLAMPNGGLQVVNPSTVNYEIIMNTLKNETVTSNYDFADQSLLADAFRGRWKALPYIYNALKTLRWQGVHDRIWRDEQVKNVHYILSPKPWDETEDDKNKEGRDGTHAWWWESNDERKSEEKAKGIDDGF
jgi:alpha-N-acetylglucosamine transferase